MAPAVPTYAPRDPSHTVLYTVIAEHLETFLASLADDPEATGLPAYVQREFDDYLRCGILAHGFLRLGCDTCKHELLVPFSCKRRGFCPWSCTSKLRLNIRGLPGARHKGKKSYVRGLS
jgi:hypothetical protein